MKDTKTVLLAMLSVGLVGTWVYHLYDKTRYSNQKAETVTNSPVAPPVRSIDSLRTVDASTIAGLSAQLDTVRRQADSLQSLLSLNRNQVDVAEKKQTANSISLDEARNQIANLQIKVTSLTNDNKNLEQEKARLNNSLAQLSNYISSLQKKDKSAYR